MRTDSLWSRILLSGASFAAIGTAFPAAAQDVSQEIVVTAQRREQAIQDVPIAVTALSENQLSDQGLAGGYELLQSIPNVNFSKGNFTGYNFQIRGVGSKVVAGGADTGVSVHLNNAPLTANRLFEADFYDIERVEVLRGPQGTLYGRNATGGVVNVITRQPTDEFEGSLRAEIANYDSRRYTGVVNVPLVQDRLALRVAATSLDRDGYGHNNTLGGDIDGRDIWAARATLAWYPTDNISAWLMYEHFEEDDNRARVGKQLCQTDPGTTLGGAIVNPVTQGFLGQGCTPSSLYSPSSLGAVNSLATLGGSFGALIGLIPFNAYQGITQDPNLRNLDTAIDPIYRAEADVYQLNVSVDISPSLTWTASVSRSEDELFTFEDYNRLPPSIAFNPLPPLTSPTGVFCDPQVGCDNHFRTFDISSYSSDQWTAEMRLQSQFDGRFNFDIGVNYVNFNVDPIDYWVFSNTLTATLLGFGAGAFVDFNDPPDGTGHNYYLNRSSYELTSLAAMGEFYYDVSEDFRLTMGVRYTDDQKDVFPVAPILFGVISNPPVLVPPPVPHQEAQFQEWTGRVGFDWSLDSSFGDSMLYAFYSRGYKGGGFNPPSSVGIAGITETFDPEFVNAYEVGLKNTLFDGRMLLNVTGFYYDYEGYQVSRIVNRSSVNENIDVRVQGVEIEGVWEPIDGLRFNGTAGWLDTEIQGGSSLDVFDRTQGDPTLTVFHDPLTAQNCVIPTAVLLANAAVLNAAPFALGNSCGTTGPFSAFTFAGHEVDLSGKSLPNSPEWTFNFGAQYSWSLGGNWQATARADYYWQDDSYSRIYNSSADQIRGYDNVNLLFRVDNPDTGFAIEIWGQNVGDETAITDAYLTDDSSGLFRNIFLTDPQTYGLRVSQAF
jgi:outer membrane receptor protein involved in Fe transport